MIPRYTEEPEEVPEDDEQSLGELYRQVKRLRGEMFALQSWAFAQDPAHGHMTLQADRETDDDGE